MTHVKICGITSIESALAAVDAGAEAVGFVFAESPRRVTPLEAAAMAAELPGDVDKYAVFYQPVAGEIAAALDLFDADVVQADHRFLDLHVPVRLLPVFREGVDSDEEIDGYLASSPDRRILYEGPRSGVGESVDLSKAATIAIGSRMTLAGGLNPDNVAEAVKAVSPVGVDVSSGVETAPGVKDPVLIREFVEAVRETDERQRQ